MKLLFVENHEEFAAVVIGAFLSQHEVTRVASVSAARAALTRGSFDAVLVDYDLDDGKGDLLVAWLVAARSPAPPTVAISSHEHGNNALMRAGANAACPKPQFHRIAEVLATLTKSAG